jgi:hypothetical protein
MPRVGFEPMILVFKQAKTVHALDHVVTVVGCKEQYQVKILNLVEPKQDKLL